MPGACLDKARDVGAAALDLPIKLADEAGEALAHRIGQRRIINHRGKLRARRIGIARHGIGTRQLRARLSVGGLNRQHALEGDDCRAETAGIERGDAQLVIEVGIARTGLFLGRKLGPGGFCSALCLAEGGRRDGE